MDDCLVRFAEEEESDEDNGNDDNDAHRADTEPDGEALVIPLLSLGLADGGKVGHHAIKPRLNEPVGAAPVTVNRVPVVTLLTLINNAVPHNRWARCLHRHADTAAPRAFMINPAAILASFCCSKSGTVIGDY